MSVFAAAGFLPGHAEAACSTSSPATGATVTCNDADTTGVTGGGGVNNVTVNIGVNGSIIKSGGNISVNGTGWTINNDGTLSTSAGNTIYSGGSSGPVTIVNNGSIGATGTVSIYLQQGGSITNNLGATISSDTAQNIQTSGALSYLYNSGTVDANSGSYGAYFMAGGVVENYATGTISGNYDGVSITGAPAAQSRVSNYGSITGTTDFGVDMGYGGTVNNYADATITGVGGVQFRDLTGNTPTNAGVLVNAGDILATGGYGVNFLNGGTVINQEGGLISTTGSIAVRYGGAAAGALENYGTITGAVAMGTGNDTIKLGAGSSISGSVDGSAGTDSLALLAGSSATGTLSSDVYNIETLDVDAAGTNWNFSGSGTFANGVTVTNGTLSVNGTLGGLTTVAAGAKLGGAGTVGSTIVNGTLAPGNSIGTLTVDGDLQFDAAGVYQVEVSPTAADFTHVTGTASLDGTIQALPETGAYTIGSSYTVLTADGGYTGSFSDFIGADAFGPAALAELVYDNNDVLLYLAPHSLTPLLSGDLSDNQQGVVDAIDRALADSNGRDAFTPLFNLPSDALPGALDQLAGETGAALAGSAMAMLETGLSLTGSGSRGGLAAQGGACSGADAASGKAAATACNRARPAFEAFGDYRSIGGDAAAGSHDLTLRAGGVVGRVDASIDADTTAGVMFGGFVNDFDLANGLGSGSGAGLLAAVNGSHSMGNAYVSAGATALWQSGSTNRTITIPGLEGDLKANDISSYGIAGKLEAGYRIAAGDAGITPFAGLQGMLAHVSSYAETGTGSAAMVALEYGAQSVSRTRSELGIGFDWKSTVGDDLPAAFEARAAWLHTFDGLDPAQASFAGIPDTAFDVSGANEAADMLRVQLGASVDVGPASSVRLTFESDLSRDSQSYGGRVNVSRSW